MKVSFAKGVRTILLSVVLISGTAWLGFGIYTYFWNVRILDPKYKIVALVQTGPEKEALKTEFLAELLGLSIDQPSHLYKYDLVSGKKKLLAFPLIKAATLKRIPPGTLYVDYTVSKPIAFLADFSNTAIDENKKLIPFKPFFSPKNLPEIILGIQSEPLKWGSQLNSPRSELAFLVLNEIENQIGSEHLRPIKIDVALAESPSLGTRQIIVTLEKKSESETGSLKLNHLVLLLNPETFKEGIANFKEISKVMVDKGDLSIVDLRLDRLAFVKEEPGNST